MGGAAGMGGSETGGTGAVETGGSEPGDAVAEPVGPTCDDGIQNQGEDKTDCGGPCPPCPGFTHTETFDSFPNPGPDGPYAVSGVCNNDTLVEGWVLTNQPDAAFPQGAGYYAVIDTTKLLYSGLVCDDKLSSPEIATNKATTMSISFDTVFTMLTASHAEVILVRDGAQTTVWSTDSDYGPQRLFISDLSITGVSKVKVIFRYVGEFDGYWMVDNIELKGQ